MVPEETSTGAVRLTDASAGRRLAADPGQVDADGRTARSAHGRCLHQSVPTACAGGGSSRIGGGAVDAPAAAVHPGSASPPAAGGASWRRRCSPMPAAPTIRPVCHDGRVDRDTGDSCPLPVDPAAPVRRRRRHPAAAASAPSGCHDPHRYIGQRRRQLDGAAGSAGGAPGGATLPPALPAGHLGGVGAAVAGRQRSGGESGGVRQATRCVD